MLAVLTAVLPGCSQNIADSDIEFITLPELRRELERDSKGEKVQLIDSRSVSAHGQGHIPGSRHMPLTAFNVRETTLDRALAGKDLLVVYGDDPGSPTARAVAKRMMALRYKGVVMFAEGLSGWRRAGLPVSEPTAATGSAGVSGTDGASGGVR